MTDQVAYVLSLTLAAAAGSCGAWWAHRTRPMELTAAELEALARFAESYSRAMASWRDVGAAAQAFGASLHDAAQSISEATAFMRKGDGR